MKLPSLTIVRFLAAFMVVASHFGGGLFNPAPAPVRNFFCRGGEGVLFFFLLSGFILTVVYAGRPLRGEGLRAFYLARFARVYPLYLLAVLITVPIAYLTYKGALAVGKPVPEAMPLFVVQKFTMTDAWTPLRSIKSGWLLQGWTLSCEALFYLSFPLVFLLTSRLSARVSVIAFFVALLIAWGVHAGPLLALGREAPAWKILDQWLQEFPPARVPDFVAGCLLGRIFLDLRGHIERVAGFVIPAIAATVVLQSFASNALTSESPVYLLFRLAYAGLILTLAARDLARPFRPSRLLAALVFLGEISYGIYLIQTIPPEYLQFASLHWGLRLPSEPWLFLLHVTLIVALSAGFYRFYEVPARRWILGRRKAPAAPPNAAW